MIYNDILESYQIDKELENNIIDSSILESIDLHQKIKAIIEKVKNFFKCIKDFFIKIKDAIKKFFNRNKDTKKRYEFIIAQCKKIESTSSDNDTLEDYQKDYIDKFKKEYGEDSVDDYTEERLAKAAYISKYMKDNYGADFKVSFGSAVNEKTYIDITSLLQTDVTILKPVRINVVDYNGNINKKYKFGTNELFESINYIYDHDKELDINNEIIATLVENIKYNKELNPSLKEKILSRNEKIESMKKHRLSFRTIYIGYENIRLDSIDKLEECVRDVQLLNKISEALQKSIDDCDKSITILNKLLSMDYSKFSADSIDNAFMVNSLVAIANDSLSYINKKRVILYDLSGDFIATSHRYEVVADRYEKSLKTFFSKKRIA